MRVPLDEHLPTGLAGDLLDHVVDIVVRRGWSGVKNGDLLRRMAGQYDVLITMDRSIEFQHRVSALSCTAVRFAVFDAGNAQKCPTSTPWPGSTRPATPS